MRSDRNDVSGVFRNPVLQSDHPAPRLQGARRRWEDHISREEVVHLMQNGQHVDLLARLLEAREHLPYDLELLRSIRVLERSLVARGVAVG